MILAIDVGNTNIVLGVADGDHFVENWRISTEKQKTADEYGILLKNLFASSKLAMEDIEDVIISTVVPPLITVLDNTARKYFNIVPVFVGPGIKTGIDLKYDNPKEIGADRIVNAVAAYSLYGGPLIIVDYGTATTFCAVSAKGEYLGGAIAPGIGISTEALFNRAAKLPRIELVNPGCIIGKTTVTAMQAGIIFGFVGQTEGIVNKMKAVLGEQTRVIATGGLAELIAAETDIIDVINNDLTLEGLKIIYKLNENQLNGRSKPVLRSNAKCKSPGKVCSVECGIEIGRTKGQTGGQVR